MSIVKAALKSAKEALFKGEHKEAAQYCKKALKSEKYSYDAYVLLGKAAYLLGELEQAALAYTRATDISNSALPAWKGLAEVFTASGDAAKAAPVYERLLALSESQEPSGKRLELQRSLIDALTSKSLVQLVREAPLAAELAPYYERHIDALLADVMRLPAGSDERAAAAAAALGECQWLAGARALPRPLEAILSLAGRAAQPQAQTARQRHRILSALQRPDPACVGGITACLARYGRLLFEQGHVEAAIEELQAALALAEGAGQAIADWELSELRCQLACVYRTAGGTLWADCQHAHGLLLQAAAVEGPAQAKAFALLGAHCREVAGDHLRARRCFERALLLDPQSEAAGEGLGGPGHARTWEGLGAAYQALGRLTAALKAYGRALELDPGRGYCHAQSGAVQMALGAHVPAAASFAAALALVPGHPPALLGAGQALLAAAQQHLVQGAPGLAAAELAEAAGQASECAQRFGKLGAAWKLLGDTHLAMAWTGFPLSPGDASIEVSNGKPAAWHGQARDEYPSPAAGVSAPAPKQRAKALLAGWHARIRAVLEARHAYAVALHLAPEEAGAWGDLALAYFTEAQLKRAHADFMPHAAVALRSQAERLLRAGLRADPASAPLWKALGCCAVDPAVREYALARALALEPKAAHAWVVLGRLYCADGVEPALADQCLAVARSHEPADAATWEAMGTLTGLSARGARDRLGCYEHAVALGAGAEALLGRVEGALAQGSGDIGAVYASARRCVELQPLSASAHRALGLVAEARGDADEAACELELALELAMSDTRHEDGDDVSGRPFRCMATGAQHPLAWLGYAAALAAGGDASGAESALDTALRSGLSPWAMAEAVAALCRLRLAHSGADAALRALQERLPALVACSPPPTVMNRLWATLQAGVAVAGTLISDADLCTLHQDWQIQAGNSEADARAMLESVRVLQVQVEGGWLLSCRKAAAALHLCPWRPELARTLSSAAAAASARLAPAAARVGAGAISGRSSVHGIGADVARAALRARAAGMLVGAAVSAACNAAKITLKDNGHAEMRTQLAAAAAESELQSRQPAAVASEVVEPESASQAPANGASRSLALEGALAARHLDRAAALSRDGSSDEALLLGETVQTLTASSPHAAQVVRGALSLLQAKNNPNPAALGAARAALGAACAPEVASSDTQALAHALLSQVEALRRKPDRAMGHIQQAMHGLEPAARHFLFATAAALGVPRMAGRAVHAAPWQSGLWSGLQSKCEM
ncbi:hypothetical protein WJX81_006942 [Elliptochloris bilobata]|uniref:Tetratricopeptide repeat protein 37 n=1 Tax=Elliptochloris bilobata TaxID=381761 RepID=A0AAW1S480_9CHLO